MSAAWTGGLYSVLRALFGLWLVLSYAPGILEPVNVYGFPLGGPLAVRVLHAIGCVAAALLAVGWRDRWTATLLAGLALGSWSLLVHSPLAAIVLVVLALAPHAPYGSLEARGRVDPGGGWSLPAARIPVLFGMLAVVHAVLGIEHVANPAWRDGSALTRLVEASGSPLWLGLLPTSLLPLLTTAVLGIELAFLPLLFVPRARPWIWLAALVALLLQSAPQVNTGFVFFFLFAFDPAWIPARGRNGEDPETIFYDGDCGLCHRAVRFVLAEDRAARFRFATIGSEAFAPWANAARELGDTMILEREDGKLAARSDAWVEILCGLGGGWRAFGEVLGLVPRPLRDLVYDGVARVRARLFAKPAGVCPVLPAHLKERFRP